jgi:hypothetical protein
MKKKRGRKSHTGPKSSLTVECVPERKLLAADTCFVQRKDTQPLTEEEKREILRWETLYNQDYVEELIGKRYTRNKDGELITVSKGGGALILEWTVGKHHYSCHFKNKRCTRDAVREIAKLRGFE